MSKAAPSPASRIPRGLPEATAFVASFCVMVIELVAGRLISRHLGSSIYTWTSVIGVVLAGLALGNALGGRVADRRPALPTLSILFLAGSAGSLAVLVANTFVGEWVFLWTLDWPIRIALHVALVFLAPSVVLGMISPVAAKVAVESSTHTGQAIGNISAWGVVGSILGTFATGYVFISAFGTTAVIWGVALTLGLIGVFFGMRSRAAKLWAAAFLACGTLAAGPTSALRGAGEAVGFRDKLSPDAVYEDESLYSHIRDAQAAEHPDRRYFHLDKLVHSSILMSDPSNLQYGYGRVYSAVTSVLAGARDSLHTLTIGGGGYTYPQYLNTRYPKSSTEVVEIDPAVTKAAIAAFGLPENHRLEVHHEDGRAYLQRLSQERQLGRPHAPFDVIYLDVFNDYSVPYQLTTVECMRLVDEALGPDGAFLMNMIDVFAEGQFLGAMVATLREVFPEVKALSEGVPVEDQPNTRNTFVLIGSKRRWDAGPILAAYDPKIGLSEIGPAQIDDLLRRAPRRLITDDWSPIENFLAPVVRQASRDIASANLTGRAEKLMKQGRLKEARGACEKAIALHPIDVSARREYANVLAASGDLPGAAAQFEEILRIRPAMNAARIQLASTYGKLGREHDAVREIRSAIRLEPENAPAHFVHGILLEEANRPEEAIAAYGEAIRLDPRNLEARNNLGIALARAGRTAEARRIFEAILAVEPKFGKARQNLQRLTDAPAN